MMKYKYKSIRNTIFACFELELAMAADEGWRLHSIIPEPKYYTAILEKKIEDKQKRLIGGPN